jgi:hypothetical protein
MNTIFAWNNVPEVIDYWSTVSATSIAVLKDI